MFLGGELWEAWKRYSREEEKDVVGWLAGDGVGVVRGKKDE
jgi:hypothetical protein